MQLQITLGIIYRVAKCIARVIVVRESVCRKTRGLRMAYTSNGSALDDILRDRAALEAHFGFHLDSDESDLDVPTDDEWSDSGKL